MTLLIPDEGWSGSIAGVPFHSPAWSTLNLTAFRGMNKRRENTKLGGRSGTRGNRGYRDQKRVTLNILLVGDCDIDGVSSMSPEDQLEENIAYWQTNVVEAAEDDRGCVALEIANTRGDFIADAQVEVWIPTDALYEGVCALGLIIPSGRLESA